MTISYRTGLGLALLSAALVACSSGTPTEAASPPAVTSAATPAATPADTASGGSAGETAPRVRFTEFARLEKPVAMAVRKGDRTLYIVEQTGRLRAVTDGKVAQEPVVDLSAEVSGGNEQGLLGVAFHPGGDFLYLDWTDRDGHTHVTEWAFKDGKATGRRDVLTQEQPYANHNGGQLAFGPDGYLYIAFGDGGSGGDPQGNGQNLNTWLGKILRIDPRGTPYKVPGDNPFVATNGAKPEIWAYGLRNPWRFTFDSETGNMWIGDVGQNAWEEVDVQPRGKGGQNYGWNIKEATHRFRDGDATGDLVDPVIEYPLHEGGNCSVIAGYVYRGKKITGLEGRFLYGDFCAGWIRSAPAGEPERAENLGEVKQLSSFGQDHDGELYALSLDGPVYRIEVAP
ncbi:Glucose/arabinose dehydrogenase, beta-propeller fold [Streptosporangium subroseum]|uniref:Glucose/arabinose dehydrogenase, beta-propeller fold n=1 Tax=Streptosporangium subroseum TaxID=106412 RepID=A0A239CKA7_9ACTN|nr:PQQ-dependent sugar dehydrogenase [Streptosporangium subroseum]SNS20342.1 Glucose/arabinose dehydrogenase, beta-propeller fold [Streptosporangium subroseum]